MGESCRSAAVAAACQMRQPALLWCVMHPSARGSAAALAKQLRHIHIIGCRCRKLCVVSGMCRWPIGPGCGSIPHSGSTDYEVSSLGYKSAPLLNCFCCACRAFMRVQPERSLQNYSFVVSLVSCTCCPPPKQLQLSRCFIGSSSHICWA